MADTKHAEAIKKYCGLDENRNPGKKPEAKDMVEEEDEDRADEKASVRMLQGQLREARREAERSETELTRAVADSESNAARADILQHRLTEVESDAERLRSLASRWRDVVMRTPSTRSLRDTPSRQSREEWHTAKGGTSDHQWRVASSLEPVRDMPRPRSLSDEDENPVRSTPAVSLPPQPRRRPPRLDEAVLTPSASPVH
jgi:chromosome segregation ATPase